MLGKAGKGLWRRVLRQGGVCGGAAMRDNPPIQKTPVRQFFARLGLTYSIGNTIIIRMRAQLRPCLVNQYNHIMKRNLIISLFAAALLSSGVANAAQTRNASDYTGGVITLGSAKTYDTLAVNVPLTLTGDNGYLDLYNGATFVFAKENGADAICGIITTEVRRGNAATVYFDSAGDVYNIVFDDGAQAIVAASAGTPITLIRDLNEGDKGLTFFGGASPSNTTLKLNGVGYNETVELDGVSFTYVGPKAADYVFQTGEIGFTGYEEGSHALNLVVGGGSVPEPTTGTLSLLALAGLCARRRRK